MRLPLAIVLVLLLGCWTDRPPPAVEPVPAVLEEGPSPPALPPAPSFGPPVARMAMGTTPQTVGCTTSSFACDGGTCTGTTPDAGNTEGVLLRSVRAYYVIACAASGETLSGSGSLLDYHCQSAFPTACPEVKENSLAITATGARCQEFSPFKIPYDHTSTDRMIWSPSGVGVSGGTALGVTICAHK